MTVWTCPDCQRHVNGRVSGMRCPGCRESKPIAKVVRDP